MDASLPRQATDFGRRRGRKGIPMSVTDFGRVRIAAAQG